MVFEEDQLKSYHELYNLIQNPTRRDLLAYIYQEPRNYTQLIEYSDLKPGSLYHHLKVMNALIEKRDHGLYAITDLGTKVAEDMSIVSEKKPAIGSENSVEEKPSIERPAVEEVHENVSKSGSDINERMNQILWLGLPNYIVMGLIILTTIALAFQGVALAGVAIYAAPIPWAYDLIAFFLGFLVLYIIETVVFQTKRYQRVPFAMIIRIISILPAAVVGISVLLMYLSGIVIDASVFPYLFAITTFLGYYLIVMGLKYLRGMGQEQAIVFATIPVGIDLLLGLAVLLIM